MLKIVRTGKQAPRRVTAKQRETRSARRLAWGALVVCALMSMAFNVRAMTMLSTECLALASSVLWPTVGVVGLKLVMHDALWGEGKRWDTVRYGLGGSLSCASMLISMKHTYTVLTMWGVDRASAVAGPLVLDIIMVLAGVALMHAHPMPPPRTETSAAKSSRSKAKVKKPTTRPVVVPQLAVA
jgi:hypothetical protein